MESRQMRVSGREGKGKEEEGKEEET